MMHLLNNKNSSGRTGGYIIIHSIVFGSIAIVIISALVAWAGLNLKLARASILKEKAIQIAEAGIDYYRWHLAHAPQDFQDGFADAGDYYTHSFHDKNGVPIGTFTLTITPPAVGSTIVTIQSEGKVVEDPTISRTIKTRLAIPSLAKFAFVSNSDMRFGVGTEIFGPIHSNGGIRFDGLAHNIVSSARTNYDDPDHSGANEFGVHTHVNAPPGSGTNDTFRSGEAPPTSPVPVRTDVFESGRQFPVPEVDFAGLTSNLAQIKSDAQASGRYFAASGALGYRIVLNPNDTFNIYRVNTLRAAPNSCTNSGNQTGWGTWSIATSGGAQTQVSGSPFTIPTNGLIFVEDHVWVEGTVNTARVTIASGRFPDNPSTRTSVTVNEDLNYTNFDGQDVVALIAQNNVNAGLFSADTLDIDAALMAQNGRVGRYYYNTSCHTGSGASRVNWYARNTLNLYGMIGTAQRYGFSYTGSNWDCGGAIGNIGSGYCGRNVTYDANLLYGPPPSFPLTSDQYQTITWEEVN